MNTVKVLVLEDNVEEAAALEAMLHSYHYTVCAIARNLQEAYELFESQQPDISIIDIYLHGRKEGIQYAESLYQRQDKHPFIFLTNAADRTTFNSARLTEPCSYLLKPFNEMELQYAIELAIEKCACEEEGGFTDAVLAATVLIKDIFFVKRGHTLAKIRVADIEYIEVDGKYCKLAYGQEKYVVQKSMKQLQDQLPADLFLRIHRNYVVNREHIHKIHLLDHEVVLVNGTSLPLSRRYLDDMMQLFYVLK